MNQTELEPPLHAGELREIERSLRGRLKSHRLSEPFIERCADEALQRGVLEYLRARERGVEIENRDAFVVRAAFCRAIDELRREARHLDGATLETLLDSDRLYAPPTEEIAVEHLAAEQLRVAISSLSAEERQVLSLHYFERLSSKRAAELLYCSERTFRRRLARALEHLARKLGVAAPEPGSDLAIEVGLAAWVGLGGGRVVIAQGLPDHLAAFVDGAREGAGWLGGRLREAVGSLAVSGAGEKAGALAGTPAAKIAGSCAGAAVLCVAGVVAGPEIGRQATGLIDRPDRRDQVRSKPAEARRPARPSEPQTFQSSPRESTPAQTGTNETRSRDRTKANSKATSAQAEQRQVEEQASGIARAASESPSPSPSGAGTAAATDTEAVTVAPAPSESASAGEEAQAEQQFGAFK